MKDIKDKVAEIGEKAGQVKDEALLKIVKLVDENGNDKIDLEDFIVKSLRIPGIKIDRAEYLRKALNKYCTQETIEEAIKTNPARAGIQRETVDRAAREAIKLQKTLATSTSIGMCYVPGGIAVDIATTVADLAQYYGH